MEFDSAGGRIALRNYTLLDAINLTESGVQEKASEVFSKVAERFQIKSARLIVVIGMGHTFYCTAEIPYGPPSQMRLMVRHNSKTYFQENLQKLRFDCHILKNENASEEEETPSVRSKVTALISGAKEELIEGFHEAARTSCFRLIAITPSQSCLVSAFLDNHRDTAENNITALIDLGFSTSVISILIHGQVMLTRVVNIGSAKIITDLADELKITREVAETVASVMPNKVESKLRNLLNPIAQELRGAIEYFEFDRDEPVNHVYISGGLTGSDIIAGLLQDSLGVPCTKWDFTKNILINLAPEKKESLQKDVFQLSDAFGAGLAWFKDDLIRLNLYADHLEAEEAHRRDPVRIGIRVSAVLVGLMFVWIIALHFKNSSLVAVQKSYQDRILGLHEKSSQVQSDSKQIIEFEQVLLRMRTFSDNRHLHARFLNALQFIKVDGFELVSLELRVIQEILPKLDPQVNKKGVKKNSRSENPKRRN